MIEAFSLKDNFSIIDSDTILFLSLHNKEGEPEKTLQECKDKADEIIDNILIATNAKFYVCCWTVGSRNNFRLDYYPDYKKNRIGKELPKYFQEVKEYLMFTSKHAKAAIYSTTPKSYEADDLVLTYYNLYKEEYNCLICSPDKDIKGLNVRCYDYKKLEYNNPSQFVEFYDFFYDMIKGQSGDGIHGIKGLGNKAAESILGNCSENELASKTFEAYIRVYGIYEGIEKFYSTYKALKIVDDYPKEKLIKPILIE